MSYEDKNKAIGALANGMVALDRLQVELCEDTPYEVPSSAECRRRILAAMDYFQEVYKLLEKQF